MKLWYHRNCTHMDIRIITTIEKIGEVDFLVDNFEKLNVLPIEVKSGKESFSFKAMTKLLAVEGDRMNQGIILSNDANVYEKRSYSLFTYI